MTLPKIKISFLAFLSALMIIDCLPIHSLAKGRDKTDKITMFNGDVVTCEIKNLQYGILTVKTSDMGTLEIKWDKLARIYSTYVFEIKMQNGDLHYGMFGTPTEDQKISIVSGPSVKEFDMINVVRITQIENRFWSRMDGSISTGLNLTKANSLFQLNANLYTKYSGRKYYLSFSYAGNYSVQSEAEPSKRQDFQVLYNRNLQKKWFAVGYTGATQNTELGLGLRLSVGGGPGKAIIQSNRSVLTAIAGFVGNSESSVDSMHIKDYSIEGLLSLGFTRFKYDSPKSKISTSLDFLPGMLPWGRYRSEWKIEVSQEIVKDFTIGFNGYMSYDSNPITIGASQLDYGANLTIGYNW